MGNQRPIARGHRFDYDRDVTEQAGPPSEERCHNVAKTRVDSGGLQETGGDDRMAGTWWPTKTYCQKCFIIINLENHVVRVWFP